MPKSLIARLALANQARSRSQFTQARRLFQAILPLATQDPESRLEALQGLADCSRLLGDFAQAIKAYGRALTLVPVHDRATRADLTAGLALAHRGAGKPREAIRFLTQAQKEYARLKDKAGLAFCAWALGGAWRIAGDPLKGQAQLTAAWKLYSQLKDAEGLSYTACALGGVARMLGRWSESRRYYTEANARMRARKDAFGVAYSYCGLGNACRMEGDLAGALAYFKKAEVRYAKIGDKVSYAYTLWSIATTQKLLWQGQRALATVAKAEKLFRATGDERGLAYGALTRAEVYFLQRANVKAVKAYRQAQQWSKPFAWEKRHTQALGALMLGKAAAARRAYAGSGSAFAAQSFPVSWP
jgi:tetratricopeptide (TPR) repeat protein